MGDHIETLRYLMKAPSLHPHELEAFEAAIAALAQAPEPVAYRNKAYPDELWTPFMFGQLKDYHDRFEPLYLAAPVAAKPVGVEELSRIADDLDQQPLFPSLQARATWLAGLAERIRDALASSGRKVGE